MKSGSMAAHEAARNIEDAIDGAEEPKRRRRREVTVGQAVDRLLKLREAQHVAADEAVRKVHERFAAREAEYVAGLTQTVKERALAMVDAEYDVTTVARGIRNFRGQCADIAQAMGVASKAPVPDSQFRDPAIDGDDEPSRSDVAESDETPSRATLEEYDAKGVMEPLSEARKAIARK